MYRSNFCCIDPTFKYTKALHNHSWELHIPVSWGRLATSALNFLLASLLEQPPGDTAISIQDLQENPSELWDYSRKLHPR